MEKFTKGEWEAKPNEMDNNSMQVWYPHGFMASAGVIPIDMERHDGESWYDCQVRLEPQRVKAKEESNANMHLIAVAPEMYDLLKNLSEMIPFLDEQTHPEIEMDAVKYDIDKLLAKARGEQNA